MGNYAKGCYSKKMKGIFHASAIDVNEEPQNKRTRESNDEQLGKQKKKHIILISTLYGTITNNMETWLVDSGASRLMMGIKVP
jgi:hypothetical protein